MADWDLLLTDARIATMCGTDYGVIDAPGSIAFRDGKIAWVGPMSEQPERLATTERSIDRCWVTPSLVDCHTHLVFAGDRAAEFEQRLRGAGYEDIARAGGGIMSTVRATREASVDELYDLALPRALALAAEGVATIEIKSGYGLTVDDELKMLEAARRIDETTPLTIRTTLLAAHTVPPEYNDDADSYIELVCNEILPAAVERNLVDAVDAYCESIAFNSEQVGRLFARAAEFGLPVKLHADQLSDGDGAALAASYGALSADHLEYTSPAGVAAMAKAEAVAVMLPGAFLTLGETQLPPLDALRENGVPMAVATDCNPGTSPICSIRTAMMLAARQFRMTPEECLAGATSIAARALGLDDRGTLEVGKRADVAVWNISHPRELAYWTGTPQLAESFSGGQTLHP